MEKELLLRPLNQTLKELRFSKSTAGQRIGGSILDGVIEIIIAVVLLGVFTGFTLEGMQDGLENYLITFQIISWTLALIIPLLTRGQTLGKMAAGTRIISVNGNIGNIILYLVRGAFFGVLNTLAGIAALRLIMSPIVFLITFICFIQLFNDENARTLQDRFARTIVVDDKKWQHYRKHRFDEIDNPVVYEEENEDVYEGLDY